MYKNNNQVKVATRCSPMKFSEQDIQVSII